MQLIPRYAVTSTAAQVDPSLKPLLMATLCVAVEILVRDELLERLRQQT